MNKIGRRRFNKRSVRFNPNRKFIQNAVEEYLDKGGKITKIEPDEKSYKESLSMTGPSSVDQFLTEEDKRTDICESQFRRRSDSLLSIRNSTK